jgi:hypothetical protein
MTANPLESAIAKLNRAEYQLAQLHIKSRSDDANGFRFNREGNDIVIRAHIPPEFFVDVSILVGEIVYHARSALEHAAWEMVPSPIVRKTGFPVYVARTKADALALSEQRYYERDGIAAINGINPKAAAIIESLQPFGPDYTSPLYLLNEMWNRDKHRLLNTTINFPQGMALYYSCIPNGVTALPPLPFTTVPDDIKHGAELFRMRLPHGVEVNGEGALTGVIFNYRLVQGQPVGELLTRLLNFSKDTVETLRSTI